jgi:two-component system response regulator (stage 0 sporulation protein F)
MRWTLPDCGTRLARQRDVPNETPARGSILIVDDEAAVAEMLRDIFLSEGYAVDRASNGGDALMLASLSRPDAVVLDMKLPDTTGAEVLARLRELDDSIPVLMLSGSDDEDLARALLKAGAMEYIRKPFDFDHLTRAASLAVEVGKGRARRGVVVPFDPERRRRQAPTLQPQAVPLMPLLAVPAPRS